MPKGIYKRTEEHKKHLERARTFITEETIRKMSLSKKGTPAWNKGIPATKEAKEKQSLLKKGKHLSPETEFKKGLTPWNKGKKCPQTSGSNNPNWKGGITPIHNQIRATVEYKLWERSVKERDGHCCQKCGESRASKIMAHHILNFSSHTELRTAIDNGVTFCRPCHTKFHKIYGKKNNNQEQVWDFVKEYIA